MQCTTRICFALTVQDTFFFSLGPNVLISFRPLKQRLYRRCGRIAKHKTVMPFRTSNYDITMNYFVAERAQTEIR